MRRVLDALAIRLPVIAIRELRALFLALLCFATPVAADTVQYVYDELGRLIAVVRLGGETTRYTYDEVGNIVSVSRQSSSQVSIVAFTPERGQTGDTVTIYGTGFSASAGQNAVTFNGTPATVASSTATTIVTIVPTAATTGPISVTAPGGSATSTAAFTVFAPQAPQITSFTPLVAPPGGTVTIAGSGLEPVPSGNQVIFNTSASAVIAATDISLTNRVPLATGGKVRVTTRYGSATGADDLFIVPSPNTAADVGATARFAVAAAGVALSLPESKIGLALFDASAGTSDVKLAVSAVTLPDGGAMTVYRPDGTTLLGPLAFGAAGTTVSLANRTSWRRRDFFQCRDPTHMSLPALTGPGPDVVALANAYCAPLSSGGCMENDFVGGAYVNPDNGGDSTLRAFLCVNQAGASRGGALYVALPCPAGTAWDGLACACPPGATSDGVTCALPATGSYGIRIASLGGAGSATVRAFNDISATLAQDGSVDLTFTTPGQGARVRFTGAVGDRLGIDLSNVTLPAGGTLKLFRPDGMLAINDTAFPTMSGVGVRIPELTQAGTYVAEVTPSGSGTGSVRMTLWRDVAGTLAIGELKNVTIAYRNQAVRMTFAGLQGQELGLDLSEVVGFSSGYMSVLRPDGVGAGGGPFATAAGVGVRIPKLTQSGIYTVDIVPAGNATGTFKLNLWTDVNDAITADTPYVLNVPYRNQVARLTFSATAGQQLGLDFGGVSFPSGGVVEIRDSNGVQIDGRVIAPGTGTSFRISPFSGGPLAGGAYTVLITPDSGASGQATVTLWHDVSGTLELAQPKNVTIVHANQFVRMGFTATAGQNLGVDLSEISGFAPGSLQVFRNSDGVRVAIQGFSTAAGAGVRVPFPSGDYTVVVSSDGGTQGTMKLTLWKDVDDSLTIGAPFTVSIVYRNQFARPSFSGTAGQNLRIELSGVSLPDGSSVGGGVQVSATDGSFFASASGFGPSGGTVDIPTLPFTTTYAVVISPNFAATGNVTVRVFNR